MSDSDASDLPLRIALLGLGTVGRDVARGLIGDALHLARAAGGRQLRLVVVAVREPGRSRGIDIPGVEQTSDVVATVGRPDIDIVVELIGGMEPAGRLVEAALDSGHHVVTANKALLARSGPDLEALARRNGVAFRFEAAVGGGIPVLAPLASDLAANHISRVRGIVNGSTNHVLTAMTAGARPYAEVVAEARRLGYLEADPTADVEGRDAADKVAILARLAFGCWPDVERMRRGPVTIGGEGSPGITGVTQTHISAAASLGLVIKLVGLAEQPSGPAARHRADVTGGRGDVTGRPAGGLDAAADMVCGVVPAAVPSASELGTTNGVRNLIEVTGSPVGKVAFSGPGAGGTSTSSAILADVAAIARWATSTWGGLPAAGRAAYAGDPLDGERRWLVPLDRALRAELPDGFVERASSPGAEARSTSPVDTRGAMAGDALALVTFPLSLDVLRPALRAAGAAGTTVLYPVLED